MKSTLVIASALLFSIASCARIPLISPPDPLYRELAESFENYDASVLIGRTIVIDPGHGGRFAGAIGRRKTREADVNLGVALQLERMLNNCGANVILTRSGDSDLLDQDEEVSAKKDLSERVRMSNEMEADLFISIHHNSTASGDRDYNAIETYYRMEDDGPSLDAARYIHKHMVRNLGIPDNSLIPGNYFVLRNNENPSLLGEASYISNPKVEKKIRKREKQLLEARAYLFGIIDYFSRGVPDVHIVMPAEGDTLHSAFPLIQALLEPGIGGESVDPSTIDVAIDGKPSEWTYDESNSNLRVIPTAPLAPGPHKLQVSFRNRMGNSSKRRKVGFVTLTEPALILTRTLPHRISAGSRTPFLLEVKVMDRYGNPVSDQTEVGVSLPRGLVGPDTAHTQNGVANFYLTADRVGKFTGRVSCGGVSKSFMLNAYRGPFLPLTVRFIDADLGVPLQGVKVSIDGELALISNRDGYVLTEGLPRGEHRIIASKNGYKPYRGIINTDERGTNSGLRVFMMEPVHGGVLIGKRIVIDSEGGGETTGATGLHGTRSIDLNIRVARYLSDYLQKAGAEVYMTRTGDESITSLSRISLANRVEPDYYIAIRHEARSEEGIVAYIAHYGTSASGRALAESIASEWSAVMEEAPDIRVEYSFVLRHTPCPAVAVMCQDIGTPQREEATYFGGYGLRESYSIYAGILRHLLGTKTDSLDTIHGAVRLEGIENSTVVLEMDDWLPIGCDESGHFTARYVPPGEHLFELISPARSRNAWWVNTEQLTESPFILPP